MGYNNEMVCKSMNMKLEEIDRERERSGWNQYALEEELPEDGDRTAEKIGQPESGDRTAEKIEQPESGDRTAEKIGQPKSGNRTAEPMEQPEEPEAEMMWQIKNQKARERDLRRMQAMYPATARILLPYVEEACDELEYEGSMMYDERPDYETVLRIKDAILEKVKDEFEPMEPPERDEMLTMQYRPGPPRRRRGNWLGDFVQTMLLEEMHRRRCRSCHRR